MSDDVTIEAPQLRMKKGLHLFGEGREMAVKKEMQQLHNRQVMTPVSKQEHTPEQSKEALGYLMFLKHKQCGKIKG